ncbi:MAG: hypothetical protein R8M46_08045, partial [Ghiorsea sp.]
MQNQKTSNPVLTFFFLALVFWLPLPLGSNRDWAVAIMEVWVFSLSFACLVAVYRNKISMPQALVAAKPILYLLCAFLIWNMLQLMPLPISFLESFAPYSASIATAQNLTFASIAIDSQLALQSLFKSFTFVLTLVLFLLLINTQTKLKWFIYTVIAAGLFQAAYGSFMVLTHIEYSFFFAKDSYIGSATGTFINRNHLAGYLEMSLAIGIGFMISKLRSQSLQGWRDHLRHALNFLLSPKILIRLILIIMCIGLIISHSRMGNSAFFTSLFISGLVFLSFSKHASKSTTVFLISL